MAAKRSEGPVFIQGILPRSGTNFLFNLLRLHPDCGVPEPIWEDWTLEESHHLIEYARTVYGLWARNPNWGVHENLKRDFCSNLGQGVISFLESLIGARRLLTKTPSVINLPHFFELFPDAYLLIVVRDGRDVVESSARSFGWDRDETAAKWAAGARTILTFDRENREHHSRYLIVRYKDLFLNLEDELAKIFGYVDLDPTVYDFEEARCLPVYGSSTFRGGKDRVHWEAISKTRDFYPLQRWSGWSRRQHERFNWIAGDLLAEFGYEVKRYPGNRHLWNLYNRLADLATALRIKSQGHITAAFEGHKQGNYAQVRRHVPPGVILNPSWLANRGVWSIFLRSLADKVARRPGLIFHSQDGLAPPAEVG